MNGNGFCETCSRKDSCLSARLSSNGAGARPQSWNDIQVMEPRCPLELIAWADIAGTTGQFKRSDTFLISSGSWDPSPFTISPVIPVCNANGTDSGEKVADAEQWNFGHLTAITGDTLIALPMQKVIFLRGGREWNNVITIDIGGGGTYHDLQLTFRDNAGTRGDAQGTIPVIAFTGDVSTRFALTVTLQQAGHFNMALKALDAGGNPSMFEMEWVVM